MSDEEDFDEFPSITVNSSTHESSSFSMPNAEELASQRAREEECEQALLRLREEHDAADRECAGAMVSALAHSDSSGSEGEAALAAAVCALRVRQGSRAANAPRTAAVIAALLPHLEDQFVSSYCQVLREGNDRTIQAITDEIASSISDMVLEAAEADEVRVWSSEEVLGIVAWLCAAAISGSCQGKRRALLRTLHLMIDDVATETQVQDICNLLTMSALESDAALELSDALRSGSERADALAHAVAERALAVLAEVQDRSMSSIASSLSGVWRRLPPPRQYLALQLLARLLPPLGGARGAEEGGRGQGGEARKLLDVLAQAAPGQRAQTTDTLKVVVAATKLQVLFHVKN